jgi:glucose-6-phosphate isomerase
LFAAPIARFEKAAIMVKERLMTSRLTALTVAWTRLEAEAKSAAGRRIVEHFTAEPERLAALTLEGAGLRLDLSKQAWSLSAAKAAVALAEAADVEGARKRLFAGEAVNATEDRAVLHMALRAPDGAAFQAKGVPISQEVEAGRRRMRALADQIRAGQATGATGKPFRALVHIGIGGSDLGPRLVWEALRPLQPEIDLRFVANVDGADLARALTGLDPETTLVVAVSKTFTTQETLANAEAAKAWLAASLGLSQHLAAVSAAPERAVAFGVPEDRVFAFWDWVGGRYSIWSAVGLSCAIALGWDRFQALLDGAAAMDRHFQEAPLAQNLPVMLALSHLYNRNLLDRRARAVVPYAQRLALLPAFLQQLEMESDGKRVDREGRPVTHATAPVVFGDAGTNGQHAFFQLLHQGVDIVPMDIIAAARSDEGPAGAHAKLLSNAIAQAEALMVGRSEADVRAELEAKGAAAETIAALAPQRAFPGDRPSAFILMDRLTPEALGALLALYEHKVFVEGTLWGINSFDQWGVELGKAMANRILDEWRSGEPGAHDPSTLALMARLKPSA